MIRPIELMDDFGFCLRGFLNKPDGSRKIVVFFHGFTGSIAEHNMHFRTFSRILAENNISSLRVSYAGNDESDGNFTDFNLGIGLADSKKILDFVFGMGFSEVYVLGFSMGGMFASSICNYKPINKLILWSAADEVSPNWKNIDSWWEDTKKGKWACGFFINKEFSKGLDCIHPYEEAKKFSNPVLIIQGTKDTSVDPSTCEKYSKAFANNTLLKIEGAAHGYEKFDEQDLLFKTTLEFILK